MLDRPLISIVIATAPRHKLSLERTVDAYRRESDGVALEILPYEIAAWNRGAREAAGTYIHLTGDWLEPHPGWWLAAISAVKAGFVPAPVIWRLDGRGCFEPEGFDGAIPDWQPCESSKAPFLSRAQLRAAGPPPDEGRWPALPCAVRCEYAFTLHDEVVL